MVDTAAHTSERLARNVNCTVRRIAPVLPSVTADAERGTHNASAGAVNRGEMHPDGDELLYLISGHIDVIMEAGGDEVTVGAECVESLRPGLAVLVPGRMAPSGRAGTEPPGSHHARTRGRTPPALTTEHARLERLARGSIVDS